MRRQIFAVMTFLIAITLHAADSSLAGTWRLTGADEVRPDGSIAEPYGARPDLRTAQPRRPRAGG